MIEAYVMNDVFIYAETEVRLTGRKATRNRKRLIEERFEITPINPISRLWKKWVPISVLYEYCTYISYHPSGLYYLGKGKTDDILKKKYLGSGTDFTKALKEHPKKEWTTVIIEMFMDESSAYDHEAFIVEPHLNTEGCLNRIGGGRGGMKQSAITHERKCKAQMKSWADPNRYERGVQAQLKCQGKPEVREKKSFSMKETLQDPEMSEKWSLVQVGMKWYYHPVTKRNTRRHDHPGEPWILGRISKKRKPYNTKKKNINKV